MPASDWTVHDLGATRGFYATRPDGARIEYVHARTDGLERVAFYQCLIEGAAFGCRVVETGDPTVIQPEAMLFIFDAACPQHLEHDVVEAISECTRVLSAGRRNPSKARISIERDA